MKMYGIVRADRLWMAVAALLVTVSAALAQGGVRVDGRLLNGLSGEALAGATVTIEELKRQVVSGDDGAFVFDGVAPGSYHLVVRVQGFLPRRAELKVGKVAVTGVIVVADPEMHYEEVVSVSPVARSQFESYQATTVLGGQDLSAQLENSLGQTLQSQPGMATRSFGPAPARPVIRGFDGDRVLILEDGQRGGDLSSQSGDHGVTVNPASAQRIEVVRGPATLLYGANAIGGLVNVITDEIPSKKEHGASGMLTMDAGTGAREGGVAGDVHVGNGTFALHLGGAGRRTGDYRTPDGVVPNSRSRSGLGDVGLSWTGEKAYLGGSYGYDDNKYGTPFVENGQTRLTPRRHSVSLRSGGSGLSGVFDSYRATLGVRRYQHNELDGEDVTTTFRNNTTEVEVLASHRAAGRLKGSVGGWALDRAFSAAGEETLSPAVDQRSAAGFIYEELKWAHATLQFGTRVEHVGYTPAGELARSFTNASSSVGLLLQPSSDRVSVAVSLARAVRNPALEELYYYGVHAGNAAFEVGNPALDAERGLGFDTSFRWKLPRVSGEVSYFRNDIEDYIFRNPISEAQFQARLPEFTRRFPARTIAAPTDAEFQFVENTAATAVLQGMEVHTDTRLTKELSLEVNADYVRGTLKTTGDPLPRMPPLRVQLGGQYQRGGVQAGGSLMRVSSQDRVFGEERPTGGYGLLKLFASYSFSAGGAYNTVTARLDNATNERYRNHLSFIKDLAPEMGRSVKVLYTVRF